MQAKPVLEMCVVWNLPIAADIIRRPACKQPADQVVEMQSQNSSEAHVLRMHHLHDADHLLHRMCDTLLRSFCFSVITTGCPTQPEDFVKGPTTHIGRIVRGRAPTLCAGGGGGHVLRISSMRSMQTLRPRVNSSQPYEDMQS